jgi:hypothetical protein
MIILGRICRRPIDARCMLWSWWWSSCDCAVLC